jgi:hypothetical protein
VRGGSGWAPCPADLGLREWDGDAGTSSLICGNDGFPDDNSSGEVEFGGAG